MRKLLVIGVVLCAFVGAASGAVGASAPAKTKPPVKLDGKVNNKGTKTAKGDKITIEADDFYFKPTFIKAKAGATVTVKIENEGGATHTFTADDGSFDETIEPGDDATVEVTIPADGTPVTFHCNFHSGSGMQGAFFVKSGSAAASTPASTSPPGAGNTGY